MVAVQMLGSDYSGQVCSMARALEVVGERWTMLILRNVFLGVRRFDQLQADLGIARNVLATRLERLVDAGILDKTP
jgi:DNA-binding HxlR family transcriptional regulator